MKNIVVVFPEKVNAQFPLTRPKDLLAVLVKLRLYVPYFYVCLAVTWKLDIIMRIDTGIHGNIVVTLGLLIYVCKYSDCLTGKSFEDAQGVKYSHLWEGVRLPMCICVCHLLPLPRQCVP